MEYTIKRDQSGVYVRVPVEESPSVEVKSVVQDTRTDEVLEAPAPKPQRGRPKK